MMNTISYYCISTVVSLGGCFSGVVDLVFCYDMLARASCALLLEAKGSFFWLKIDCPPPPSPISLSLHVELVFFCFTSGITAPIFSCCLLSPDLVRVLVQGIVYGVLQQYHSVSYFVLLYTCGCVKHTSILRTWYHTAAVGLHIPVYVPFACTPRFKGAVPQKARLATSR